MTKRLTILLFGVFFCWVGYAATDSNAGASDSVSTADLETMIKQVMVNHRTIQSRSGSVAADIKAYEKSYKSYRLDPSSNSMSDRVALQLALEDQLAEQDSLLCFIELRSSAAQNDARLSRRIAEASLKRSYKKYDASISKKWEPGYDNNKLRELIRMQGLYEQCSDRADSLLEGRLQIFRNVESYPRVIDAYDKLYNSYDLCPTTSVPGLRAFYIFQDSLLRVQANCQEYIHTRIHIDSLNNFLCGAIRNQKVLLTSYNHYFKQVNMAWRGSSDAGQKLQDVILTQEATLTCDSLMGAVENQTEELLFRTYSLKDANRMLSAHFRSYNLRPQFTCSEELLTYNSYLREEVLPELYNISEYIRLRQLIQRNEAIINNKTNGLRHLQRAYQTVMREWTAEYSENGGFVDNMEDIIRFQRNVIQFAQTKHAYDIDILFKGLHTRSEIEETMLTE